jgi:hypothetical protein
MFGPCCAKGYSGRCPCSPARSRTVPVRSTGRALASRSCIGYRLTPLRQSTWRAQNHIGIRVFLHRPRIKEVGLKRVIQAEPGYVLVIDQVDITVRLIGQTVPLILFVQDYIVPRVDGLVIPRLAIELACHRGVSLVIGGVLARTVVAIVLLIVNVGFYFGKSSSGPNSAGVKGNGLLFGYVCFGKYLASNASRISFSWARGLVIKKPNPLSPPRMRRASQSKDRHQRVAISLAPCVRRYDARHYVQAVAAQYTEAVGAAGSRDAERVAKSNLIEHQLNASRKRRSRRDTLNTAASVA